MAATESQWMVNSLELEISTKDDTINTLQREVDYLNNMSLNTSGECSSFDRTPEDEIFEKEVESFLSE